MHDITTKIHVPLNRRGSTNRLETMQKQINRGTRKYTNTHAYIKSMVIQQRHV